MPDSGLPLLRSPPFPWVGPAVAAVSVPGRSTLVDPERLFAAMRQARVGGAFWSDADCWADDSTPSDDEGAILRWIATPGGDDCRRADAIAAIEAASYRNPFTGEEIDAHGAVAILADWRRLIDANRPVTAAVGMAAWKRPAMEQFLWDGAGSPPFRGSAEAVKRGGGTIVYWPSRVEAGFAERAAECGIEAWQVEDGFLRSDGLGVECRPPMSVIVDRTGGIHFDPSNVSEIEMILAAHRFDEALIARAARLREAIVAARLCKYGIDRGLPPPALPKGRRVVLAVGQVEDDLSVVHAGGETGMAGFLARVRACEPDAFLIYRPHPDVAAGLRRGEMAGEGVADLVVTGGSLLALIERVDAVHVVSSLTGFEALLRRVPVTVHGMPFYAGWGLTRDLATVPERRGRRLSLDELVAGALILAPRYRDPVTELPCPPEVLVERLAGASPKRPPTTLLSGFRRVLGATRRTLRQERVRA